MDIFNLVCSHCDLKEIRHEIHFSFFRNVLNIFNLEKIHPFYHCPSGLERVREGRRERERGGEREEERERDGEREREGERKREREGEMKREREGERRMK